MLIIVEDRNITFLFQFFLDLKASRSGDILKVNTTEGSGDHVNSIYDLVYIMALNAKRECVYIAECLEQYTFTFHYRHTGFRSDVTKTKNCGTVCYNKTHIPSSCKLVGFIDIFLDLKARLSYTWCICKRKVVFILNRNSCNNLDLTFPISVQS